MASEESVEGGTLTTYTAAEVKEMYDQRAMVLIDVRTVQEYGFQHIKGALLYPLAAFDPARLPASTEDKPIVFHCGSGVRSKKVATACLAAGMTRVAHLGGGFAAWKQAGYPFYAVDPMTGSIQKNNG
ncbi:MAG: rhodanese-like domain-containing protein [Myxococcota bacterium]